MRRGTARNNHRDGCSDVVTSQNHLQTGHRSEPPTYLPAARGFRPSPQQSSEWTTETRSGAHLLFGDARRIWTSASIYGVSANTMHTSSEVHKASTARFRLLLACCSSNLKTTKKNPRWRRRWCVWLAGGKKKAREKKKQPRTVTFPKQKHAVLLTGPDTANNNQKKRGRGWWHPRIFGKERAAADSTAGVFSFFLARLPPKNTQ